MVQFDLILLGLYFMATGFWWLLQVSKKYYTCIHKHLEFHSSASFAFVGSAKFPIEGLVKLTVGLIATIGEFFLAARSDSPGSSPESLWRSLLARGNKTSLIDDLTDSGILSQSPYAIAPGDTFLSHTELGTVCVFLVLAGLVDIMVGWSTEAGLWFGQGGGMRGLDYLTLALFFLGEGLLLYGHSLLPLPPLAATYSLSALLCLTTAAVTALELYYPTQVLCPLMRSYLLLTQGSWLVHVALMMESDIFPRNNPEDVQLVSMFFAWHCGANFMLLLIVWMLIHKLMALHLCCCVSALTPGGTDVYLENRVRFDYRILDSLDSDIE